MKPVQTEQLFTLVAKVVSDRAELLAALEGVMDLVVAHTQAQDERVLAALKALQHAKESP